MAKKKLLLAAIIVGALAAALIVVYIQQKQTQIEKETGINDTRVVVVASRAIPAGTPLEKGLISYSKVPTRYLPPNPIMEKDADLFLGATLTVNVEPGKYIQTSDFARTEVSRDLSGKVPLEERAMSIPVDAISGVSGLLRPGDRVDLLGTFPVTQEDQLIPGSDGEKSVGYVTMTLLQNVTLLAVGQQLSEINAKSNGRAGYSTVTASLTIKEAELLTIAQTRGKLTLLLRNADDVSTAEVGQTTLRGVLEDLAVIQKVRQKKIETKRKKRKKPVKKPGIEFDSGNK